MSQTPPPAQELLKRIADRSATLAVVGLGYVGLPLVRAMHGAGFTVVGFDLDESKVADLNAGKTYLHHLGEKLVPELTESSRFSATNNIEDLGSADVVVLCVPSPLGKHNEPDMAYIVDSMKMVSKMLKKGMLVCLESTTYPGTTRQECLPILEAAGLTCGEDFFLAYSPEREDPGREGVDTQSIPKLVGGVDPVSTEIATAMYSAVVDSVIPVDSAEVAESAKLLENIYRAVNIALVNELKPVMHDMGIDIWKVVQAAATKPFGFQPFYPGPGLGGHCIPIDPFYLTWKAKEYQHNTRFIELAGEINSNMPRYVVQRTAEGLNQFEKSIRGSRILVVGIAYKPNVDDVRETPAAEIIKLLAERGADVAYHDPHVLNFPSMRKYNFRMDSADLTADYVGRCDCVLVCTNHDAVDWQLIADEAPLVIDTRNAMAGLRNVKAVVYPA